MNEIGVALVWCSLQVTAVGVLAAGLYVAIRRAGPPASSLVVLTSLAVIVALSLLALSPWPHWSFIARVPSSDPVFTEAEAETAPASSESRKSSPSAELFVLDRHDIEPEKTPKHQASDAGVFWQTVLQDLTVPPAEATVPRWRWPAIVIGLFLTGVGTGILRFLAGLAAVRRYRLRSRPLNDAGLLGLVDSLRAELGCWRPIEVRQSDDLVTAAAVGWQRPVILLPAEWTGWNHQQRRAVLAHEIAHVRSHDFPAMLVGYVGLVLHFYHPLVHWLLGRLRLEQELTADAAASAVSGGRRKYLTTIAELALRQQDRPLVWPARSFLPTRTTFLRRIAMLRDAKPRPHRPSPIRRVLSVGIVLFCGFCVAGLRGPVDHPQVLAQGADQTTAQGPAATQPAPAALATPPKPADSAKQSRHGLVDKQGRHGLEAKPSADQPRTEVDAKKPEQAALKATYQIDFREANFDVKTLMPFGFKTSYGLGLLKPELRGLRIVIPYHQGNHKPDVGFFPLLKIVGDFEITASYEMLTAETPKVGAGAGANLYIMAEKTLNAASLRRCVNPEGDHVYFVHDSIRGQDEKRRPHYKLIPNDTRTGKLRLARTGLVLQFLVAEEDSDQFRKLHEVEFGDTPIGAVRVEATTDGSQTSVETLWKDLAIRASKLEPLDVPLFQERAAVRDKP